MLYNKKQKHGLRLLKLPATKQLPHSSILVVHLHYLKLPLTHAHGKQPEIPQKAAFLTRKGNNLGKLGKSIRVA